MTQSRRLPSRVNRTAHLRGMKVTFGSVVVTAGVCGILSFAFLATSLGTEYWYIIEMNPVNASDFEDMSSHSGLWSINEGRAAFPPQLQASDLAAFNDLVSDGVKCQRCIFNLDAFFLILSGGKMHADSIDAFTADYSKYSETELHMLSESLLFLLSLMKSCAHHKIYIYIYTANEVSLLCNHNSAGAP